jgi:hypothetical protein
VLVSGWDCRYVSGFIIVCADVRLVVVDMTQIFTQITLLTCGYTFWSAPKGRREADRHNLSDNFVTSTIFPFPPSTPFFPPTFVLTLYNMFHFFFIYIFFFYFYFYLLYIYFIFASHHPPLVFRLLILLFFVFRIGVTYTRV